MGTIQNLQMGASTSIRLFILLIFGLQIGITPAQPDLSCYNCSDTNGNYTIGSIYSMNLKTVLSTLISNAGIHNGYYYNVSVVQDSDRVNGIAVCRADKSPKDCRDCVSLASNRLADTCLAHREAIGYYSREYGDCMVRYSNRPIFKPRENSPNCRVQESPSNIPATDLGKLKQSLANLLAGLQHNASAGNSSYKFSSGAVEVADSINLYGLAQCNPYLSSAECSDCLGQVMGQFEQCCSNLISVALYGPICIVEFANYPIATNYTNTSPQPFLPGISTHSGESGNRRHNADKTWIIGVAGVASFVLIATAFLGLSRRNIRKEPKQEDSHEDMKLVDSIQLDFKDIQLATDNFSDAKRLDNNGSSAMYKGLLPDGQEIVVKRLHKGGTEGELEFDNEVLLSTNLQHKNLVKLLGFCIEKDLRILVYEFLPNGSLQHFLNDPVKRASLDWQIRYRIISGLARGLLYLHEDSQMRVIHRDLKPSNILLGVQMDPKISNFKTASLIHGTQSRGDTKVMGTYGYMPIEYVRHGHSSIKSDIFSYGVILLEIITGYIISGFSDEDTEENLLTYAWRNWCEGTTLDIVDEVLPNVNNHMNQIKRCIKIGLLCVQEDPRQRPNMSTVVVILNSDTIEIPQPSRPSPLVMINNMDLIHSNNQSSQTHTSHETSLKDISHSYFDPR